MRSATSFLMAGVVVLGFLSGPSVAAFRQEGKLAYQWKKGLALKYRIVQKSTTVLSGMPGGMGDLTIEQSATQVLNSVVDDVAADGTATLRQSVEAIKMEIASPMMTISFDSAAPEAAPGTPSAMFKDLFSQMIGQPFTMTMAPTGEVKKVEGVSQLADKMFKSVAPDPSMAGILDSMKANMNDDAMRTMFAQSFAQLPDRPVKIGDSWDSQVASANPMLGTLITSMKATLKSVDADGAARLARIATAISVKRDASKPVPPNPMGLTLDVGEASGDGEQGFDISAGQLRSSVVRLTIPMSMSGTAPDGTALNVQTQVKSTTTIDLVK